MTDAYYDDFADYYKLIYLDWEKSVQRQADILNQVIQEYFGDQTHTILDAACGIGTQSIGLARLGYKVTGSDLSASEVTRAQREALEHGVEIEFNTVDMRDVWNFYTMQFDVVLACDNSIPHLLSNEDIQKAFSQFFQCTRPGGGCIISVRDYAQVQHKSNQRQIYPRQVHTDDNGLLILFDVWEFNGNYYDLYTYIVEDKGKDFAQTKVIRGGRYYCVEIPVLQKLLIEVGFREVILLPDRFFQPLLIALK